MGKKYDASDPAATSVDSPAPNKPAKVAKIAKAAGTTTPAAPVETNASAASAVDGNVGLAKPAVKKKPTAAVKKKAPAKKAVRFTTEEIALKAYFISEHRHRHGLPGDEHSDWIEAERQLVAEAGRKTPKKAASKKKG